MNILIFNWRDPKSPNAGGAEIVTSEHAKGWIKAGHTVTWFSSSFRDGKETEVINGISFIRKGSQVFGVQVQALLWYLFSKHPKYDLVIDQFHGIPFFTPLFVRTKKIGFIHEVTKELWKSNPWPKPFNILPYVIGSLVEPWIFKLFYKKVPFLTVSQSTKNDLIKWNIKESNITVIDNGVHVLYPTPLPFKEEKKTIIFFGALAEDKGIEDAIKVFSLIKQQEKGWQFWVAGKSDKRYLIYLTKLTKEYDVNEVKFWGYVSEKKKYDLLARSHILLNPSFREGWGLVNIEANALGTPVVAYDVPGCRDSIKNNQTGKLVSPRNCQVMADVVMKMINDKNVYMTYCKNARTWSEEFSWGNATQASLKFINNVAKDIL